MLAKGGRVVKRELLLSVLFVMYASRLTMQERVEHLYDTVQGWNEDRDGYFSKEKQRAASVGGIGEVVRLFKQLNADSFAI